MAVQEIPRLSQTQTRLKMSFEEFMAWEEECHAEWKDGEVVVFMPAKGLHQAVLNFLNHLLDLFVTFFNLGKIRLAPYAMRAQPDGAAREPDLLFVAKTNQKRLTDSLLQGPADLVVELISDESVRRDRQEKFHEYREAGVREYWIIDPRPGRNRADFFRLDENGQYELFATEDDERVESTVVPGFWIRPSWLWQVEDRDPLQTFFEILTPAQKAQIQQLLQESENSPKNPPEK